MAWLNSLLLLAFLCTGIWIWRRLRAAGVDGMLATALTFAALWVIGSFVSELAAAVARQWAELIDGSGAVVVALAVAGMAVLIAGVGWLIWGHWRARRFFDL
jgi:hypothetical protein